MKVSRETAGGRWELPPSLQITPENRAEFEAALSALVARRQSPFANLSPAAHAPRNTSRS